MTEPDSDQLVLREAMAFSGQVQPIDPSEVIKRARRRRSRHRTGAVVGALAMTAAVGVGATATIDGLRQPAELTVSLGEGPTEAPEVPAPVETVGTHERADLGHGWTVTARSDTVCVRGPGESDGPCAVGIGEVSDSDYRNGDGIITLSGTRHPLTLFAWLVPAETSTTVVTADDGSRLPADVYALSEVPGARLAVVFVEDENWSPQRPHRRLTSYDSTGAVVADWPIRGAGTR